MRCAVFVCNSNNNKKNSENKTSFFNFPKNPKVCKQWVFLCRRKDKFEPKNSRICSKHFQSSDFVPKTKILEEHGLSQPIRLMPNVIPSLGLPFKNEKEPTLRQIRMNKKARTENQTPKEINVDSEENVVANILCASDFDTPQGFIEEGPETPFVAINDLELVDPLETHFLGSSTLLTAGILDRGTQTGVSSCHNGTQTDSSYIDTQLLKNKRNFETATGKLEEGTAYENNGKYIYQRATEKNGTPNKKNEVVGKRPFQCYNCVCCWSPGIPTAPEKGLSIPSSHHFTKMVCKNKNNKL